MSAASRFFSVPARHNGRVVCRLSGFGAVWAWRAPRSGQRPSPACLFFSAATLHGASGIQAAARVLGWCAWLKPGNACAVWSAGPLAAQCPPWACKVELPAGLSAAEAHAQLNAAYTIARLAA